VATIGDAVAIGILTAIVTRASDATVLISQEAGPIPAYAHAIDPSLTLAHTTQVHNRWICPQWCLERCLILFRDLMVSTK